MSVSKYAVSALTMALLAGCGGGSNSSDNTDNGTNNGGNNGSGGGVVVNNAPVAANASLTSSSGAEIYLGSTLTLDFNYSDAENDPSAGAVEIQWYRLGGQVSPDGPQSAPEKISGANSASYQVTAEDVNHTLRVIFKPSASSGTSPGQEVLVDSAKVSANSAPVVRNLAIKQNCEAVQAEVVKPGSQLQACFVYSDADNDAQDAEKTQYRWAQVNTDNSETDIGSQATLTVPFSARGKTIKLFVTPYAQAGIPAGTTQQANAKVDIEGTFFTAVTEYDGKLNKTGYFTDGSSEGTSTGLVSLGQINATNPDVSKISHTVRFGDKLYYIFQFSTGNSVITQSDLDGNNREYIQGDLVKGLLKPNELQVVGNTMLLSGETSANGRELWVVRLVDGKLEFNEVDIAAGSASSSPTNFVYADSINTVFFTAVGRQDGKSLGRELYKLQLPASGSNFNPTLVKDIRTGVDEDGVGSVPLHLSWVNGRLYFSAWDGKTTGPGWSGTGRTLWASNGTSSGTVSVADLDIGKHSYPSNFSRIDNNRLFFMSNGTGVTTSGRLYVAFGSTNATELNFSSTHGEISLLTEFPANGSVLYQATAKSDGVAYLWELKPQGNSYNPTRLSSIKDLLGKPLVRGNEVFYSLKNDAGKYHLAKSVNTELNTPVSFPRSANDEPKDLILLNNRVVFTALAGDDNSRNVYYLDETEGNVPKVLLSPNNGSDRADAQPELTLPAFLFNRREL